MTDDLDPAMLQQWRTLSVDSALQELFHAIQKGANLPFESGTEAALDQAFRPSFEKRYRNPDDWKKVRPWILTLGGLVGRIGGLCECTRALKQKKSPTGLGPECAKLAAGLVKSSPVCQVSQGSDVRPDIFGRWCDDVPDPDTARATRFREAVREVIG